MLLVRYTKENRWFNNQYTQRDKMFGTRLANVVFPSLNCKVVGFHFYINLFQADVNNFGTVGT